MAKERFRTIAHDKTRTIVSLFTLGASVSIVHTASYTTLTIDYRFWAIDSAQVRVYNAGVHVPDSVTDGTCRSYAWAHQMAVTRARSQTRCRSVPVRRIPPLLSFLVSAGVFLTVQNRALSLDKAPLRYQEETQVFEEGRIGEEV